MNFDVLWPICFVVCLLILVAAGFAANKGGAGALIDKRNRFSLNRFQFVVWSLVIISAFAAAFFANDFEIPPINAKLLGLIGISTASVATAGAVKSSKDVQAQGAAQAAANAPSNAPPPLPNFPTFSTPRPAQMVLEEEGAQANQVVNVTKFQNLILTLVAVVVLVIMIWTNKSLDFELTEQFLWLLGISHAGYVGGKVPNKT